MKRTVLTEGWRLKQIDPARELDSDLLQEAGRGGWGEGWLKVGRMPAMVHEVLLRHDVIETPWLPGRAEACRWVAERDWVYATRFAVEDAEGQHFLRLKGLDTIVDVYLNGTPVYEHSCASTGLPANVIWTTPFAFDARRHLKYDQMNTIAVRIYNRRGMGGVYKPVYLIGADSELNLQQIRALIQEEAK